MRLQDSGPTGRSRATAVAVLAAGLFLMLGLRLWVRPHTLHGLYSRDSSSESMVQTVSLLDLRESPGETLLVLHIQPPLLDSLRGLLAHLWPNLGSRALVVEVDRSLSLIWAVFFGLMGVFIFRWLERLLATTRLAALGALLFLLHPAAIYYATFLEGTFLTAFGVLWLCYALWAIPDRGATLSLSGAYLLLFFLRSIFQWPALVVLVCALLLRKAPRRSVLVFTTTSGLLVGGFMLKQYALFGSTTTSSFAGSSCLNALGDSSGSGVTSGPVIPMGPLFPYESPRDYPSALTRRWKITGAYNYNHITELGRQRDLLRRCVRRLESDPVSRTLGAYLENASIFLRPSSRYPWSHAIVDRLPWRGLYDWVFSGPRLVLLLTMAGLWWVHRESPSERWRGLGLALPVVFVATVCVVFERGENMRFKFFIEPSLYVFLVAQLASAYRAIRGGTAEGRAAPSDG